MEKIDLQAETSVPFRDVPGLLPRRNGKKIHYRTVYRWATCGARGRVLESRLVGGIRYTTIAALNRFLETSTIQANEKRADEILQRLLNSKQSK